MAEKPFKDKFYGALQQYQATEEESAAEFEDNDFRWAETKMGGDSPTGIPKIYINHQKFKDNPDTRENYVQEMLIGEGLHLIKEIDPERAERLYTTAVNDPDVLGWLKESYRYEQNRGEERPFEQWVKHSRLDQIIGGYLLGGKNSSVPTMQSWPTERLPYGTKFKAEVESLKKDLGLK